VNITKVARRKLRQLEIANRLDDLRIPPGNHLEALKGDRSGQYSIRINDQWRVCFRWTDAGAENVEIVDYHWGEAIMKKLDPITPGEILFEEFLKPMGLSQYRLAKEIGVPAQRISEIVLGKRSITADTDLRLCRFFGLSNGYWLRAQVAYDTEVAERTIGRRGISIRLPPSSLAKIFILRSMSIIGAEKLSPSRYKVLVSSKAMLYPGFSGLKTKKWFSCQQLTARDSDQRAALSREPEGWC
jgi:addiction module HigA family antidote